MKRIEKLAEEYSWTPEQQKDWMAGFRACRELAAQWARNHPNEPAGYPYGFCQVCGGGPEIAKGLDALGEDEVPDGA